MDSNQSPTPSTGSKTVTTIVILIIVLVLAFVAWKIFDKDTSEDTTNTTAGTQETTTPGTTDSTNVGVVASTSINVLPKNANVTLNDSGFSPKTITVNEGDTVTFTNNSSGKMWVASAPHPQHTDYPGFDEKSAANNGGTYTFTFTKSGTWKYHNHLNPSQFGSVTVVATGNKD